MKKQSGFTLIELMVVMAIIAILATAGLAAYTGYIKKARDAKRIADISAINTIILGATSVSGIPPATVGELQTDISNANNGQELTDPIEGKNSCMTSAGANTAACAYYYKVCDAGTGYGVAARFESSSNLSRYTDDDIGVDDTNFYEAGNCKTACTGAGNPVGCPALVAYTLL